MIKTLVHPTELDKERNLNKIVENNFKKVDLKLLIAPGLLLILFFCFFTFYMSGSFVNTYVDSQKEMFLQLNHVLSIYPNFAYNITFLGNALVVFPFVFIFLFVAPKLWEAILTASLLTLITSAILKTFFAVPRPAAMIDMSTFTIMGRPNILHTSFPSGHSMTAFMIITILLYAYMPKKMLHKVIWTISLLATGFIIAFSRVAIGAHYPLDVVLGCTIGYLLAVISIRINNKQNWLCWMKKRRFYPISMLILLIWTFLVVIKLIKHNLFIFYLSLFALITTLLIIANKYVKENKT